MLGKFLDPKNDLAFKRIFGSERNKDIAIHFLNDIFGRTTNPIEHITFLKTAQDPEIAAKRESIVDILCEDLQGNRFVIEMQVAKRPGFEKRAQYYAAKAYIEQRGKEHEYHDLKQVTLLSITDFTLFPEKNAYLSHHVILDKETLEHDLKDFSFSFLELPKFKKTKHDLITMTEKWTYFFKHAPETSLSDLPDIIGGDKIIERAYSELDRHGWSEEELRYYESIEMKQDDDRARLKGAKEEGISQGELTIIKRLLEKRFGSLSFEQALALKNKSEKELLDISDRILNALSIDDAIGNMQH